MAARMFSRASARPPISSFKVRPRGKLMSASRSSFSSLTSDRPMKACIQVPSPWTKEKVRA
eukprot:3004985-Lingulodinium_polyedra.AAC.1